MGERNNPDAGETTLAAATAAIITARWSARSPTAGASGHGSTGNGHGARSQGPAEPVSGSGNGHGTNGHGLADGHAGGRADGNGHAAGFGEWVPPAPPSGALTDSTAGSGMPPVSPAAAPPYSPAAPQGPAAPPAPGGAFFSPVAPDPVPEVFDARAAGLPNREPGRDAGGAYDEVRTQVPPGFERRDFGRFSGDPTGGRHAGQAETGPPSEVRTPEGLLGVLPPSAPAMPIPASFAPPEPAPWVDAGWVDFPHELEPSAADAVVGAGAAPGPPSGRPILPRRVPRVPDMDYPLFESDPGEPAPDPATQRQELSRIATFLREPGGDEAPETGPRPDGVDLQAVLGAVRQVPEVRDAQLGWNDQAGHTLRIEFFDGVDESAVTRSVVRLLRSRLGLPNPLGAEEPTLDRPFSSTPARGTARPARSAAAATVAGARPLPRPFSGHVPRLVLENVSVTRLGAEANVEVRLRRSATGAPAIGEGRGPGVDAYLSRLAATAAAHAIDRALAERGKVFVEHVSVVPFGVVEVAVVVLLLAYDGVTEQHSGSAIVGDDPHVAVVRATLGALNRRLESLLG